MYTALHAPLSHPQNLLNCIFVLSQISFVHSVFRLCCEPTVGVAVIQSIYQVLIYDLFKRSTVENRYCLDLSIHLFPLFHRYTPIFPDPQQISRLGGLFTNLVSHQPAIYYDLYEWLVKLLIFTTAQKVCLNFVNARLIACFTDFFSFGSMETA